MSLNLYADSWRSPTVKRYYSEDSTYFIQIVPTKIPDNYGDWKRSNKKRKRKFTAADTTIIYSHGRMFKIDQGDTLKLWEKRLVNRDAPVNAFVAPDGKYLVTFDDWYSTGYGPNVMVVYNEKGELLKQYQLEDFSPFALYKYPKTISSIIWHCGAEFTSEEIFKICFEDRNKETIYKHYNLALLKFTN